MTVELDGKFQAVACVLSDDETSVLRDSLQHTDDPGIKGTITEAATLLGEENKLDADSVEKIKLAVQVAEVSLNDHQVVKALDGDPNIKSLPDVAFNYDQEKIAEILPDTDQRLENAAMISRNLYVKEPSAAVAGMIVRDENLISDPAVERDIVSILTTSKSKGDILTAPIADIIHSEPQILQQIPSDRRERVMSDIKALQRVQSIAPTPAAFKTLIQHGLTSASEVSSVSQASFLELTKGAVDVAVGKEIHANAVTSTNQRQAFLYSALEAASVKFPAFSSKSAAAVSKKIAVEEADSGSESDTDSTDSWRMDKRETVGKKKINMKAILEKAGVKQLNLDTLFGESNEITCEECLTVYSPAAYFVDLLQFLRGVKTVQHTLRNEVESGYAATALESLFRRRPDLQDVELSCANTETTIPYVDLANEVMESFIINLNEYSKDVTHVPKQTRIEAFNSPDIGREDSLWQPQNTKKDSYKYLAHAIYPLDLPYHQPIDTIRVYLGFLRIDPANLFKTIRPRLYADDDNDIKVRNLQIERFERRIDAELIGMTEEEYIILTKQAFCSNEYYASIGYKRFSQEEYQKQIGVASVEKYFGYANSLDLLSLDPDKTGLSFVEDQLLRRTGLTWTELVDIVQTDFFNPRTLDGADQAMFRRIKFSYKFLQTLENPDRDENIRYKNIAKYVASMVDTDEADKKKLAKWVESNFKKIGETIVLESHDGPFLCYEEAQDKPIDYLLRAKKKEGYPDDDTATPPETSILQGDGLLLDEKRKVYGHVDHQGRVLVLSNEEKGTPIVAAYRHHYFQLIDEKTQAVRGKVASKDQKDAGTLLIAKGAESTAVSWKDTLSSGGASSLRNVTLTHLNGSPLAISEWDRFHRFVRLRNKIGWPITEVNMALTAMRPEHPTQRHGDITPEILHQLHCVKQIVDLTELSIENTLTLFVSIPTVGLQSLYQRLFLRRYTPNTESVFAPDQDGQYLPKGQKISKYVLVLSASLGLKASEILTALNSTTFNMPNILSLESVSSLYRLGLLCKILNVSMAQLSGLFNIFASPLASPSVTLDFIQIWDEIVKAGFSFDEIDFILDNSFPSLKKLSMDRVEIMLHCKKLQNAIRLLEQEFPDHKRDEPVNIESFKARTHRLYDDATVDKLCQLLDGSTVYTIKTPNGFALQAMSPELKAKLKYLKSTSIEPEAKADLQIQGLLTENEMKEALDLLQVSMGGVNSDKVKQEWAFALSQPHQQAKAFLEDTFFSLLPKDEEILLAGDAASSIQQKRSHFLSLYLPFLRRKLSSSHVVDQMANIGDLKDKNATSYLLSILRGRAKEKSALADLLDLAHLPQQSGDTTVWKGSLLPPSTDDYSFSVSGGKKPLGMYINNKPINFLNESTFTPGVFFSDPKTTMRMEANRLYELTLFGIDVGALSWKYSIVARNVIPDSALIPDFSGANIEPLFNTFRKASIVIGKFGLTSDDIQYIYEHRDRFDDLDFNSFNLGQWKRLQSFATFKSSLSRAEVAPLHHLFNWASSSKQHLLNESKASNATSESAAQTLDLLPEKISAATNWNIEQIREILKRASFYQGDPVIFTDERALKDLREIMDFAEKADVNIGRLYEWAALPPLKVYDDSERSLEAKELQFEGNFDSLHRIAKDIQLAVRSNLNPDNYASAIRPLNDIIRENQKTKMISYLLNQDVLSLQGVFDADALFEFFLIDVQMTPLVETSRIKQAISTVQLYVQRCLLGLEHRYVSPKSIDRSRWDWLKSHTTWAANRKIFLYPENWLEPSLRDDKSPFFKDLEGQLLQKELDQGSIRTSIQAYMDKVAEVANLIPVALHIELLEGAAEATCSKIHLFGRTRTAPFAYYYRHFDLVRSQWVPWEKIDIDVPHYITDAGGIVNHLTPMVWKNRLLLFMPQIVKRTLPLDLGTTTFEDLKTQTPSIAPATVLDVQMSWSEYKNGKWTPRQLSSGKISTQALGTTAPPPNPPAGPTKPDPLSVWNDEPESKAAFKGVESLIFVPILYFDPDTAAEASGIHIICCLRSRLISKEINDTQKVTEVRAYNVGGFRFYQGQLTGMADVASYPGPVLSADKAGGNQDANTYGPNNALYSTQGTMSKDGEKRPITPFFLAEHTGIDFAINTQYNPTLRYVAKTSIVGKTSDVSMCTKLYNEQAFHFMNQLMSPKGVNALYESLSHCSSDGAFGANNIAHELSSPYSLYNWELGLHAPLALADRLLQSQQFEQALAVCHYIFDPLAISEADNSGTVWRFPPFATIQKQTLEQYYLSDIASKIGQNVPAITEWSEKPFQPHVVARTRPIAYMKWVVTKYIEILIAYGDSYFRQGTLESVPNAIQMYVMASHLFGPRGQRIPRRKNYKPQTYRSLEKKLDPFSNSTVQLEEIVPFSNQTALARGLVGSGTEGVPTIFGAASTLYFGIPSNPKTRQLGATIDDRLFKLRHSQDMNGIQRKLPLFEPPIDPGMLAQAKAQGIQISNVIAGLNGPMPNYRFIYLLGRASELASEVRTLASAFLTAKEKLDNETYVQLRAKHSTIVNANMLELKTLALEDARKSVEALEASRRAPAYRLKFYLQSLGMDVAAVPNAASDFQDIDPNIGQMIEEGGLKLLPSEKEEIDRQAYAHRLNIAVGSMETLAGIFLALPSTNVHGTPIGVGAAVKWGPPQLGHASQAVARGLKIGADVCTYDAMRAGRKAGALRAMHDRVLQANQAGQEIKSIDKQILVSRIRASIAEKEVAAQHKSVEQDKEAEEFLKSKYTNAELYTWISNSTRTIFYEMYNQAYDLAAKAAKAFKFERPHDKTTYIQPGYWDPAREGLLCGERLHLALKKLETAYQESRGYDYEISKQISLRQLDPMALIMFRETGSCELNIPERLFDMDFPGHYLRRIKSVSITIPCIVGPYASLNCTLRLLSHKYRTSSISASQYAESTDGSDDPRFSTANVPISSIAVSSAQDDSGQFELNFRDERYIPFEGAGAISSWRLELPTKYRQFAYETISDVILRFKYTSLDGGGELKAKATESLEKAFGALSDHDVGLHTLIDIKNEYSNAWLAMKSCKSEDEGRVIRMSDLENRLPMFTRGMIATVTSLTLCSDTKLLLPVSIVPQSQKKQGETAPGKTVDLTAGNVRGVPVMTPVSNDSLKDLVFKGAWDLKVGKGNVDSQRVWLLVGYTLAKTGK